MTDICYPEGTDWTCAYSAEELQGMRDDPAVLAVMERAESLAWMTLSALSGYRISTCPTLVRPCALRCAPTSWVSAPVSDTGFFSPHIIDGGWYNACGCQSRTDCSCSSLCEVILPSIGSIVEVRLNGAVLDPTAYRIDNGRRLVRTDGECWPYCQDMSASIDDEGTFSVLYYSGVGPNDIIRYAAGVLASEFFKACTNRDCRLPSGVTNISRQGMSIQVEAGSFPGGMTGIHEVDAVLRIYNPHALKSPSRVMSPDRRSPRIQTGGY